MGKKLLGVIAAVSLAIATTLSAGEYKLKPPTWPNAEKVVFLMRGHGEELKGGSGCPIADEGKSSTLVILTAAHVARYKNLDIKDTTGRVLGEAHTVWTSPTRDLAIMVSNVGLPGIHLATEAPAAGDRVMVVGPVQSEDGTINSGFWPGWVLSMVTISSEYTREKMRPHVAVWAGPGGGTSGTCFLNAEGEAVAIGTLRSWWGGPKTVIFAAEPLWGGWK